MTRFTPPAILFEDNHLIAVNKPAGLATQSGKRESPSLLEWTRQWIGDKYRKPGKVYLGLVHRLDRVVSGVVLFARTSKAASRLSEQFRSRTVEKQYLACVKGVPEKKEDTLIHYLRKEKSLRSTVFPRPTPETQKAELTYRTLEVKEDHAVLEVKLLTGRFHQIRAQLAFIGHPIVGDTLYRSSRLLPDGRIALHASSLTIQHPTLKETLKLEAPLPEGWPYL